MESNVIEAISELKIEVKYIGKALMKLEQIAESQAIITKNQAVFLDKQDVANKRILQVEKDIQLDRLKIRALEDWKMKSIAIISVITTIGYFFINKFF